MRFLRPGSVEVVHIRVEHTVELLLMQDQEMIEALTPYTSQKTLTDGIRARGVIRSFEHLDMTRIGNPREAHPKLAIVITDEVLRPHTKGGGDPSLLCGPSIGGIPCDTNMDYSARVSFDDEESIDRPEKQVGDWEKVTGPDLLSMGI
jgi:hypothetical protein